MYDVIIMGGGIAGLATAHYLQKESQAAGHPIRYALLEADSTLGGKICTERQDGFVIEGGPDSFITQKPWGIELCDELGLTDQLIPSNDAQGTVYIYRNGKLHPIPDGFRLTVPTRIGPILKTPLLTLGGKLRMGIEPLIPARRENTDESLASFIRRRFGKETLERLAGPLMSGIYVADPTKLSVRSTFPMFVAMEKKHGSLIVGMLAARRKAPPPEKRKPMFVSFPKGMSTLTQAIAANLTGDIITETRVKTIEKTGDGFGVTDENGKAFEGRVIIPALPAHVLTKLLRPLESSLADALGEIRYVSTATVSLGFREEDITASHLDNGFGIVIPRSEGRRALACTWSSTKFSGRANRGCVLIRVFLGGYDDEHLVQQSDEELLTLAREELQAVAGVAAEPLISRIFRWHRGNPQYDVGHLDRVARIEKQASHVPGLFLSGSALRGIGIPDCIHSGRSVAEKAVAYLQVSGTTTPV